MASIVLTGAGGFLGWHTRSAAHSQNADCRAISVGTAFDATAATASIDCAERLIHIAGVNRASDDDVRDGNILFAEQLAEALRRAKTPPPVIVYANSTQQGNGTPYGEAKARAAGILRNAAAAVGATFEDIALPNLFGEHGRPFYNSVVATFCHLLATGGAPKVDTDRELTLLHAQNAADLLLGLAGPVEKLVENASVTAILRQLEEFAKVYASGEIPDIATPFDRDLFNTYRSFTFPGSTPISLDRHADNRGSFFEIIRSHGGTGQSSFSTTVPGISRGDHYHRRKVERFTVLSGEAEISLRKLFTDEVFTFPVSGSAPKAIDMPTMWAHNIVNTGDSELYTSFWSNEIFDPNNPDTFAEAV